MTVPSLSRRVRQQLCARSPLVDGAGRTGREVPLNLHETPGDIGRSSRTRVHIAHCEPLVSAGLVSTLRPEMDVKVVVDSSMPSVSNEWLARYATADVVIADYDGGLQLLAAGLSGPARVLIVTHAETEAAIRRAFQRGVRGYLLLACTRQDLIDGIKGVRDGGLVLDPRLITRIGDLLRPPDLTRREEEVLRELMLGLPNKSIARNLGMRLGTVKTHVKSILEKLEASTRTEAVSIAQRRGILASL